MSQSQDILEHMQRHGTITPIQALELYGCFRLAARICELRESGEDITTERPEGKGKDYAVYRLRSGVLQGELF